MTRTSGNNARIILFTRYPEAGRSKTRLIPALGADGAAALQRRMTERMVAILARLVDRFPEIRAEIHYEGGDPERMRAWLGSSFPILPQRNGDLGERLAAACSAAFADGVGRLVLIGADCPALDIDLLGQAFCALLDHDLVLGPALDGGYYLLGLRREATPLFRRIPWGTEEVLAATCAAAKTLALSISLLEPLADVDRPEDLAYLGDYSYPQ